MIDYQYVQTTAHLILYSIGHNGSFFLLELCLCWFLGLQYNFTWAETAVNTLINIFQLVINVAFRGVIFGLAVYAYHFRPFNLPENLWLCGLFSFIIVEFTYYAGHVYSHQVRLGWLEHSVHHTSGHYNLSMSFRRGAPTIVSLNWLQVVVAGYLGVPPHMLILFFAFNRAYQFFMHTRLPVRMEWLGLVFVTPAQHRMHHGLRPEYFGKNFGGVLIIFDRIFGTYLEPEKNLDIPIGIEGVNPESMKESFLYPWISLYRDAKGSSWTDKVKILFLPPDWVPTKNHAVSPVVESRKSA